MVVGFIFYSHSNIDIIMVLNESLFSLFFSSTFKVLSFLLAQFPWTRNTGRREVIVSAVRSEILYLYISFALELSFVIR